MSSRLVKATALLFVLTPGATAIAQELAEVPVCNDFENPELVRKLQKGFIEKLNVIDAGPGSLAASKDLASSFLENSGKGPKWPSKTPPASEDEIAAWEKAAEAVELHSCRFSPKRAFDKDIKSAWCEGKGGDGAGQILLVPLWKRGASKIEIRPGYARSRAIFKANNRPHKVRVFLLTADVAMPHQYGDLLKGIRVIGKRTLILEDENDWQVIDFPEAPEGKDAFRLAAVEILSVYKGKRYNDTCISEIRAVR